MTPAARTTKYRHQVRYLEVDQQGVVFNMWYLGYFDEAMSAFLGEGGLPYEELVASGHDVQLVRSEIDWISSLKWGDDATTEVELISSGTTSFTLGFAVSAGETLVARGRTVYVVIATDGTGKRPIPDVLGAALGIGVG